MRVQQLARNSYIKTLTPVESKLLERLKQEEKQRLEFSYLLEARQNQIAASLTETVEALSTLNGLVGELAARVQSLVDRVEQLANSEYTPPDVYTRSEIDAMLAAYQVEEITRPYAQPDVAMFNSLPREKKWTGYRHFPWARLKAWPDPSFGPGTMRRYSIAVYAQSTKELVLPILHEDYFVVRLNGATVAALSGNNLAGPADEVRLSLQPGWNDVEFLLANQQYRCSFDIGLDLAREVDAVAALVRRAEQISSASLLAGSVDPQHLKQVEEFTMRSLALTATDGPALAVGDATGGSIVVGGAELAYDGSQLVLNAGLKVGGLLEYESIASGGLKTSFLWLARDIYLPPARVEADPLAAGGQAVLVPASASVNVIDCEVEGACPGPYTLYFRVKPAAAAQGRVVSLRARSGAKILAVLDVSGDNLDPLRYQALAVSFEYEGGDLVLELYAGGAVDFYFDLLCVQFGR